MLLIKEVLEQVGNLHQELVMATAKTKSNSISMMLIVDENAAHLKLKLRKNISDYFKLSFGADYFITKQ